MGAQDEIQLDPKLSTATVTHPEAGAEVSEVAQADPADPAGAIAEVGEDAAIAEALASGALDPAAARERLILEVAREQLPDASPEAVAALAAEMSQLLADDPTLADLLAGL